MRDAHREWFALDVSLDPWETDDQYLHLKQRVFMLRRTLIFVIIWLCSVTFTGCNRVGSTPQDRRTGSAQADSTNTSSSQGKANVYGQPVRLAELEDRAIKESSGIVASRRNPDVFWTHNDSGDDPIIYAFDRDGRSRGRWRVTSAQARDWEDIAAGPGPEAGLSYLYIGDIGDNEAERDYVIVYRVVEPSVATDDSSSPGIKQYTTEPAEAIRLKYPDGRHDAETLLVHPTTGDLYLVTKSLNPTSGVYKLKAPYSTTSVNTLVHVDDISVRSFIGGVITGGDISPDGRRVILCDYLGAGELVLPENVRGEFDEIWKQPIATIDLGPRKHGEAVCYRADGLAILATSERRPTPLIEVKRTSLGSPNPGR